MKHSLVSTFIYPNLYTLDNNLESKPKNNNIWLLLKAWFYFTFWDKTTIRLQEWRQVVGCSCDIFTIFSSLSLVNKVNYILTSFGTTHLSTFKLYIYIYISILINLKLFKGIKRKRINVSNNSKIQKSKFLKVPENRYIASIGCIMKKNYSSSYKKKIH